MTYTHLTTKELEFIEDYFENGVPVAKMATRLKRARQTIYNVVNFLKKGGTAIEFSLKYDENKKRCGRKRKTIPPEQKRHIEEKAALGWSPKVIKGRGEMRIDVCATTIYRRFEEGEFDIKHLYMQGKRRPNGHAERRGKQSFTRNISTRIENHPNIEEEFGHLEGDTIVGKGRKSCVITLVDRITKAIITLSTKGRKANNIEEALDDWLSGQPKHLWKSITFDCGKEFSNWKNISNKHDLDIYFADPGRPGQRGLNENSNGLLRHDGLPKETDFNNLSEREIQAVARFRNAIPRASLDYKTPLEAVAEQTVHVVERMIA
jgi:IS30 family transposase